MFGKIIITVIATGACLASASAQPPDFPERVERIIAYMAQKGKDCLDPPLESVPAFKACAGESGTVSLTISTELPIRDDDGRVVSTCPATLTATKVPGFSALKMDAGLANCPEKIVATGEFAGIFMRTLLLLSDWVVRMEKPV
jgi:hypothetical protein